MKKFICLLLILSVALLPTLASCHKVAEAEAFVLPESFDTSREYELTFWAKNDTNITQANIYKEAIADFKALYPNIHITIKPYTDYSRIYNDVITNIPTSTTPNICITYPDHIATYNSDKELVVSLDSLLTDEAYGLGGSEVGFDSPSKDEMIPEFLSECYLDGSCYALPFMRSTEVCYINKTYVEKLGYTLPETLTWDFIWEVSEAATKKNADGTYVLNGTNTLIPFIYKSTDNMMIQMLAQKGAEYSDEHGNIGIFNDTTKEILYTVAEHAESGAFSTFKISSYPANYLNAGECIFAIDSTAGATWMGTDAPNSDIHENNIVNFDIEVTTIPQFDTESPKMISQGPSVCIFNKDDPQEVLASWLFVQYLVSEKVQLAYAATEGYVPVTAQAQQSEAYLDYLSREGEDNETYYDVKIQATKLLLENTENTFITPVFNGSASLRNAAGQMIEEVTKAIRRKKTVNDEFISELYEKMVSLYKLNLSADAATYKAELGPLPTASVALLSVIGGVWVLLGAYIVVERVKKSKKEKKFSKIT
ncbi:MAG: extracellular solute-binding protein [Clostridia bacterium]|nr:extracellular solute-binding protein [Clostridia bacterium]